MRSSSARSFLDVADWWKQRFVAPVRKRRPAARHRRLFAEALEDRMVLSVAGLDAYLAADVPDTATVLDWGAVAPGGAEGEAVDQAVPTADPQQVAAGEAACAAGAGDGLLADEGAGDGSGGALLETEAAAVAYNTVELGEGEGSATGTGLPPEVVSATWQRSGEYWFISGLVSDDRDMFGQTAYFGAPLNTSALIDANWNFYVTATWGDNPPSSLEIYTIDSDGNASAHYTLYFI